MIGSTRDTDEISVQHAILEVMKDGRVWTNAELKKWLANELPWTDAERAPSPNRPCERIWENRVNNALSPARKTSLNSKGYVESIGHGKHRITEAGIHFIKGDDFTLDDLIFKGG